MNTFSRFCKILSLATLVFASFSLNAAIVAVGPASGFSLNGSNVIYSPVASQVYHGTNSDFNPQSPTNIASVIESIPATGISNLTNIGACDGSGCDGNSSQTGNGATSGTFGDADGFNVLALHFGNNELVFIFSSLQTNFEVSGLSNGISNWRAYDDPKLSQVPIPGAVWLFGSAIIGLISFKRKTA